MQASDAPVRSRYVGRLAPSPSGRMHIGVARTLLAGWLDARKNEGRLLLRIEDIDRPRVVPGAAEAIMRDLEWLGLDWDGEPVWQSQRDDLYLDALEKLRSADRAYACFCSRKEIAMAASAPHGPQDDGVRYPGTCRSAPAVRADRTASMRLKTFTHDRVEHTDLVFGGLRQSVYEAVGDFIIRRSDGLWAYQLAVTVDDLDNGVTRIVRGNDLLLSTPRQLLLRQLLDAHAGKLETLHVPLIRDASGKRLAKRDGALGISSRREAGESAPRIVGELASTLGLVPKGTWITPAELVSLWDPSRIGLQDFIAAD